MFELARSIQELYKKGVSYEQIAVIMRKNRDLLVMAEVLEKNTIPSLISTDESIFSDAYIQKIISLLKAIYFIGDDSYLARVLLMDIFPLDPLEVFTFIQAARKIKPHFGNIPNKRTHQTKLLTHYKR